MTPILSKDNPAFRRLSTIRSGRPSEADRGLVLLEGFRLCEEAILSGCRIDRLIASDRADVQEKARILMETLPAGVRSLILADSLFRRLCTTESPQGVLVLCESPVLDALPASPQVTGRYLVLEEIRDPGNLGSMIRTADAARMDGVIMTPGCVDAFNDKALRASMGSVFHIALYQASFSVIADWFSEAGLPMIAADLTGEDVHTMGIPGAGAILIGNEGSGLSPAAMARCDLRTKIPMPGRAESLNAAAAAAILIYEMLKASEGGRSPARCSGVDDSKGRS